MGGGGDGGYEKKQAEIEAKKQEARDALNLMFGVAPTGGVAPSRADFTTTIPGTSPFRTGSPNLQYDDGYGTAPTTKFDQAGYDAALAKFNGRAADATKNKAARDALYDKARANAFTAGSRSLGEKRDAAQRNLKFALFAQGLNGGSVDVDENALLNRTNSQGILDLGAKADAVRTDLQGNDEQTRLGLLQSIDAGMDQGSALSSALNQLKINSDRASSTAQGTTLGDLFADAGLLYTKSEAARGSQAGRGYATQNLYPTTPRAGSTRGAGGVITPVS